MRLYQYEQPLPGAPLGVGGGGAGGGRGQGAGSGSSNDLKRLYNELNSNGRYRCAHAFDHSPGQGPGQGQGPGNVTAMACMNSVASPLLLSATSDRRLLLLDAAVGKTARTLSAEAGTFPHDRAAHCIALPQPSMHTTSAIAPSEYSVFATAAIDNSVTLYDIRVPRCAVVRYGSHVNRREPVGIAFSPCLRYMAVGSEDRSLRVLDVRGGFREAARIANAHRDVTIDVAYSPLFPQLASASYDGTIKFYVE